MAVKITKKYICDICGEEYTEKDYSEGRNAKNPNCKIRRYSSFPVIFITNQTDGSTCKPYIDYQDLDLCNKCALDALNIYAQGAQGYNKFWMEES